MEIGAFGSNPIPVTPLQEYKPLQTCKPDPVSHKSSLGSKTGDVVEQPSKTNISSEATVNGLVLYVQAEASGILHWVTSRHKGIGENNGAGWVVYWGDSANAGSCRELESARSAFYVSSELRMPAAESWAEGELYGHMPLMGRTWGTAMRVGVREKDESVYEEWWSYWHWWRVKERVRGLVKRVFSWEMDVWKCSFGWRWLFSTLA